MLVIPDGSYDINELMREVKSKLESNSTNSLTYTLEYNEQVLEPQRGTRWGAHGQTRLQKGRK